MSVKRGLTFSSLQGKSSQNMLDNAISSIIRDIDAHIMSSHSNGMPACKVDLPVTFGIATVKDSDAQLYIYSELINLMILSEEDGGKGFDPNGVHLEKSDKGVAIVVRWKTMMDDAETRKWRQDLLKSYIRQK